MSGRTRLVVITGLSGAGKSTAVHALEDQGYFCVDNMPTPLVPAALDAFISEEVRRVGMGLDIRVRAFWDEVTTVLDKLDTRDDIRMSVLFLDASDEALLRRFSSTRRPHPLSTAMEPGGERAAPALLDGITAEREIVGPLRARADVVIDTTELSVHDLRRRVLEHFGSEDGDSSRMRARIVSFGFKYGAPVDADMVLDVRFLPNPHFVDALREHVGTEQVVSDYVLGSDDTKQFLRIANELLTFCLQRFEREGKAYATVAIGCTGGRHRSVAIAEWLGQRLENELGMRLDVVHRDVRRAGRVS